LGLNATFFVVCQPRCDLHPASDLQTFVAEGDAEAAASAKAITCLVASISIETAMTARKSSSREILEFNTE
jgi:hypothetical protein